MATWHASLPQRSQHPGYSLDPVDPVARTEMEFGAARARRRTFARNDMVAVSWKMTDAQMAIFRTWFEDSAQAAGGSAWFYVPLAIGTTDVVSVEARFKGGYKASLEGPLAWVVSANLEVR